MLKLKITKKCYKATIKKCQKKGKKEIKKENKKRQKIYVKFSIIHNAILMLNLKLKKLFKTVEERKIYIDKLQFRNFTFKAYVLD